MGRAQHFWARRVKLTKSGLELFKDIEKDVERLMSGIAADISQLAINLK
jgi:hypothetical protein